MQKNWYIIYTKPKWERKVTATLKKRKIENFLPLHYKQITSFRRSKTQEEPLFQSYVFANVTENEIFKLFSVDGVINLVYWKGEPAKIKDDEIEIIKDFISDYQDITLEKTKVNETDVARIIDGSRYSMSGNILTIKNTVAKAKLPSMGITLVAKVETIDAKEKEMVFGEKDLWLQS